MMRMCAPHVGAFRAVVTVTAFLVMGAGTVAAQTGTARLIGEAMDGHLVPIADVMITVEPVGWVGQVNSDGSFVTPDLTAGDYAVSFSADGFRPRVFEFTIPEGASGDIELGPVIMAAGEVRPLQLRGRAISAIDSAVIANATVTLNDEIIATTDGEGRFDVQVEVREFTSTALGARRVGFVPNASTLWLSADDTEIDVDLPLEPLPVMLEEIVVSADRTVLAPPHMRGYFEREREGGGDFISSEEIDRLQPYETTDLLRRVPGILITERVVGDRENFPGKEIKTLRGGGRCQGVLVYIDGQRVADSFVDNIDRMVDPRTLAGVEVYTGAAEIPVIFNPTGSACGVLVFWLK